MQSWQRHPSLLRLVAAFAAAALVIPAAASAWTWPVSGPILRGFLFSEDTPLAPGQHRGIDVEGALGDPVLAPVSGTVTFVGRVAANGLTVTIQTADGYTVTLLHLGAAVVERGAVVAEGQPVAVVGSSGVPEYLVPYVQFGVRLTSDPEGYLDPQAFLPPLAPPSVPPAPSPEPQPAPVVPPAASTPPPAVAPRGALPADRAAPPRAALSMPAAPDKPVTHPSAPRAATPYAATTVAAVRSVAPPNTSVGAAGAAGTSAARALRPLEADGSRTAAVSHPPQAHRQAPSPESAQVAPQPAATWIRPLDPVSQLSGADAAHVDRSSPAPSPNLLALVLALMAASCLCAYGFRRRVARIIGGDALLPDDADLLRELEPAHRARVHDDRRGRARPAPQAAR